MGRRVLSVFLSAAKGRERLDSPPISDESYTGFISGRSPVSESGTRLEPERSAPARGADRSAVERIIFIALRRE